MFTVLSRCPIKNQILYFSIYSIKYTVLQYTCAKNRIKQYVKYTEIQYTLYCCAKYSILTIYFYNLHTEIQYTYSISIFYRAVKSEVILTKNNTLYFNESK